MKKILFLLIISALQLWAQPENPGPYQAGWISGSLEREGRNLSVRIYYPSFAEGSEAAIDTLHGPYQPVAFGHGFLMQNSYYISHYKHLASYGFVVIAPQFPDTDHLQLAYDLLFCVDYIKAENANPASRFYNRIDTSKAGLSGHSMGGGASLLAAANDSSIAVAAPLAAAETNPSAIAVMDQIQGVVYLISAENDGITPPSQHQIPMYNAAKPVKGLPIIKGGNHTKFMDTRIWDWTDPNGYLSAEDQLRITRRYLAGIFNLFLKEDSSYFKYVFGEAAQNDDDIIFEYQLKPLPPLNFTLIYPRAVLDHPEITFLWHSTYSLNLYDTIEYELIVAENEQFANIVLQVGQLSDTTFTAELQTGTYFWKVKASTSDSTFTFSNELSFTVDFPSATKEGIIYPAQFSLGQNYPNPFNPATLISYRLPVTAYVELSIYNLTGQKVALLVSEEQSPAEYRLLWDVTRNNSGRELAAGVYFYRLSTDQGFSQTRKMVLLR